LAYLPQIAPKSKELLDWIVEVIKNDFVEESKNREIEIDRLSTLLSKARQRKDKYYEAMIDQNIPEDFCKRKIEDCREEEENLISSLNAVSEQSDVYKDLRIAIHRLAFYANEIYQKSRVDDNRILLSQIFTNLLQNGYEIWPKYTLAAEYLSIWMPKLNRDYELDNILNSQGQTGDFSPVSPVLLAWKESLRMTNWQKMFIFPTTTLQQINHLFSLVQ
jgi:hypothetical protein